MFNEPSLNNPPFGSTRLQPYFKEGSRAAEKHAQTPSGAVSNPSKGHLTIIMYKSTCVSFHFGGLGGLGWQSHGAEEKFYTYEKVLFPVVKT